ncbi:CbrC family protein [Comamonas terrigena]|uniref:CbrC family protein n=1 Tax=Comamonas terrigena TaxID=32013 RepID=UPI00289A5CA8|nr:CbrC family protein [Comamonas terrigena]
MSERQPFFRFNPGAYQEGRAFEPSDETCGVCAQPCGWKYRGNIYMRADGPTICACCIADGRLGALLEGEGFSFHDVELDGADPALEQELLERTPGVACFNPFEWPVLDSMPMAFLGYGEDKGLLAIDAVRSAISETFAEVGWTEPAGPSPYLLVFKEVNGDRYRAVLDLD